MNRVTAAIAPPSQSTASRSTTSKCSSNLVWSWPPSASPTSLDHGFQVHLQIRSITTSKCTSELYDLGLQMHLQTHSIMASMCIPELHDHSFQMHLHSRSITASKCISELNDLGLQVHLQTRPITASKCISELRDISLHVHPWVTWSRPPSASLSSTWS